jgi:phosphoribosyl 1,2-cyclic phosphodiesterase
MMGRFTVLASGSSGNAALLECNGFGLLIDCGLQPRILGARMREVGASWEKVNAVILTHTHGDHWKDFTLADMKSRRIPLYAHPWQLDQLAAAARSYDSLRQASLLRSYAEGVALEIAPGLVVRPVRVDHDAEPTFAFRIDRGEAGQIAWSVGYASDLGCGSQALIDAFAGVDVLALEFNHDVQLERRSQRPKFLIDRVLSDSGHLSNDQAGELAAAIVSRTGNRRPSHLVQLHLSRHCNKPELAQKAGRAALAGLDIEIITARQDRTATSIPLAPTGCATVQKTETGRSPKRSSRSIGQPLLPGFDA